MAKDSVPRVPVVSDADLARRTLRTVGLLVFACVLFVGALSIVAVAITTRAVGSGTGAEALTPKTTAPQKPLSI